MQKNTTQIKAALFDKLSTVQLVEAWEATDTQNAPEIPTVRGWIMDEMERRNPQAFEAWLSGEATIPARHYFLKA